MMALLLSITAAAASAAAPGSMRPGYALEAGRTCDGYPRLPIETMQGLCAGLVVGIPPEGLRPSKRLLHLPRTLLALAGGDFLVVDLGGWETGQGAIWRLQPRPGQPAGLTRLLGGLDLPHTAALGPDGAVYVGEMGRVIRFDPNAPDPSSTVQTVIDGLPDNHLHADRHPLSSFLFDADGALLVNVGAPSDQCVRAPDAGCDEVDGDRPAAAIWRYAYLGDGRWDQTPTVFARGLRNSVALARHASGAIFQGENSIDVDAPDFPFDEINRLQAGRNYGWPNCVNIATPAPAWRGRAGPNCASDAYAGPALLLPPHSAPLSMLYYRGAMFPQLAGRLIVSLHGYRATGARIIAYAVDSTGAPLPSPKARYEAYAAAGAPPTSRRFREGPAATGLILTPGWGAVAGRRPAGSPVGMAVAADGALWLADDRNGAIIRFARDGTTTPDQPTSSTRMNDSRTARSN